MKKQLFGLSGTMMAVLLVAGCASDPLEDLRDVVSSVSTSLSYTELLVGASIEGRAQARDAQGNALATLPDISSANTAVALVTDDPRSGAPEPTKIFSILATGFGITTITASAGGNTADITVQTFPASVAVTGVAAGTQVGSGSTVQLAATALGTDGTPVAGGPSITWASEDVLIATVDNTGLVTTAAPGLAVITATTDGGAVGQASFEVVPGTFDGTVTDGARGDVIVVTAGSVAFDGDEVLTAIDGVTGLAPQFLITNTSFLLPNLTVGAHTVTVTKIGPNQLAQVGTFNVTGNAPVAANPDRTAPTLLPTTIPQGYLVWLTAASPDDYHSFDNTTGADVTITFTMDWAGTADMDLILRDCTTFALKGFAASLAQPEVTTVTIPAGECWVINSNLYSGANDDVSVLLQ